MYRSFDILSDPPAVSFEFFPPATDAATDQLWDKIQQLAPVRPKFVSVTYGAGGSTREHTHRLVKRIREQTDLLPAAHLTCVDSSRDTIRAIAESYCEAGITQLVALRGDAPKGGGPYQPHPDGYAYADDLVRGLMQIAEFDISVAAYPETHPEARSAEDDIDHLKRKFDAGASRAITQYFFDVEHYFRFMDRLEKAGITQPVIPGILPVVNYQQMVRFSAMCGASVPDRIHRRFAEVQDPELMLQLGIETATKQCLKLYDAGVRHFHFYTLNRAPMVLGICQILGLIRRE